MITITVPVWLAWVLGFVGVLGLLGFVFLVWLALGMAEGMARGL